MGQSGVGFKYSYVKNFKFSATAYSVGRADVLCGTHKYYYCELAT
jgi:hypothetical protein